MKQHRGFTLIEVMVALAIVAISLAAGAQAYAQWTDGARLLHERMLATVCLQNQWTKLNLAESLPATGYDDVECLQDGQIFRVRVEVASTANARFRKIQMAVTNPKSPDVVLGSMITAVAK